MTADNFRADMPVDASAMARLMRPSSIAILCDFLLCRSAVAEHTGDRLEVLEVNPLKLFGVPAARVVALDGVLTLGAPPMPASIEGSEHT